MLAFKNAFLISAIFASSVLAFPPKVERSSTSGSAVPASYVQFTNHGSQFYYDQPGPLHYVSLPIAAQSGPKFYPEYYVSAVSRPKEKGPRAPYYQGALEEESEDVLEEREGREGVEKEDFEVDEAGEGKVEEIFDVGKYSERGEKGEAEFEKSHGIDEADKSRYKGGEKEGYYNDVGESKKAQSKTDSDYAQHEDEEKQGKGSNYEKAGHHQKGFKTTGFSKVYHKNEYKKDTDFYDEDHKSGSRKEFGEENKKHYDAKGALAGGKSHDSEKRHQSHGKKGQFHSGHDEKQHKGYEKAKGDEAVRKDYADYSKKGASNHFHRLHSH